MALLGATPHVRYAITVDLLRNAGSDQVPALGDGPLDAAFAFPAGRFGAARVEVPVAVAPAQRAFDRCPRQDPGHTTAGGFDWSGTVRLERRSPRIGAARLAPAARRARSGSPRVRRARCACVAGSVGG